MSDHPEVTKHPDLAVTTARSATVRNHLRGVRNISPRRRQVFPRHGGEGEGRSAQSRPDALGNAPGGGTTAVSRGRKTREQSHRKTDGGSALRHAVRAGGAGCDPSPPACAAGYGAAYGPLGTASGPAAQPPSADRRGVRHAPPGRPAAPAR